MSAGEEQKLIKKVQDSIFQWTPLVWSTERLLSITRDQILTGVVASLPFLVISGVWAVYRKNFISTIKEWAGSHGRQHAQTLTQFVEQAVKRLKYYFTSADSRFARAQGKACCEYLEPIARASQLGSVPKRLNEVYVPLVIQSGVSEKAFEVLSKSSTSNAHKEAQYIWDLLRQAKTNTSLRRVILLAPGGFGKTTLLKSVAYRYGLEPKETCSEKQVPLLVPILLYLKDCQHDIVQVDALDSQTYGPDLSTLVVKYLPLGLKEGILKLDTDWAKALLKSGKAVVMLDGFDEVSAHNCGKVSHWLDKTIECYGETTIFVMSSRFVGYARHQGNLSWTTVRVDPFNEEQRDNLLRRWYFCHVRRAPKSERLNEKVVEEEAKWWSNGLIQQINQSKALVRLADNPLMLVMIATHHYYYPGRLPTKRHLLYQRFLELLLKGRPQSKGINLALSKEEGQSVLQNVALRMVQAGCSELSRLEMTRWIQQAIESSEAHLADYAIDVPTWLKQLEEVSELLVYRTSTDSYGFTHRSFQEYLAAAEVTKRREPELLMSLKPEWRDTALIYATQTNPAELIERLLDRADPTSLDLAYDCWIEHAEDEAKLLSQTLDRIKELQYQQLENSLLEGDWKSADGRTYRILLQVLRKRYGDSFTRDEIASFPRKDLLHIDRLWMEHSNDKLGFSAQKKIYVDCGGSLSGKYESEPYACFFQVVGWCKDGKVPFDRIRYKDIREIVQNGMVRSYEDLTSEDNPPEGSFPDMDLCATNGGGLICYLAARL